MDKKTYLSVRDDQAGEGTLLAFPGMSSCAAIIAVLPTTLVAMHKTQGYGSTYQALVPIFNTFVNGRTISELFIVGWNVGGADTHDPARIRQDLNCANVSTYIYNTTNDTRINSFGNEVPAFRPSGLFKESMTTFCTFATFDANGSPKIGIKRTSKITITPPPQALSNAKRLQYGDLMVRWYASDEEIETPTDHRHILKKGSELQKV